MALYEETARLRDELEKSVTITEELLKFTVRLKEKLETAEAENDELKAKAGRPYIVYVN